MKDNLHLIARHVQCEIFDHNFKCRPNQLPVKLSKYLYKKCWPKCHSQEKKKNENYSNSGHDTAVKYVNFA